MATAIHPDAVEPEIHALQSDAPGVHAIGLAAGISAFALSACGGGETDEPIHRLMNSPKTRREDLLRVRQTVKTPGILQPRSAQKPTADELMDWAQQNFPDWFPGSPSTLTSGTLSYRAYSNGNYLGVLVEEVLLLGPATNDVVTSAGQLADYASAVFGDTQPLSAAAAARFLALAAFGGTPAEVANLQNQGIHAWLDDQFSRPLSTSHWDWMVANGYAITDNRNSFQGVDNTLWRKLMESPDVLRQRVVLALSELFVISMSGLPIAWRGMAVAAYVDVLETHAFGNYRSLLEAVTLSVGMGSYLNMRGNQKADGKGREPDENYAREVMQLFTIGLVQLQADGTPKTANGQPLETYTPDDIRGLARVFTGWDNDRASNDRPDHAGRPMVFTASRHSPEAKSFLGVNLPPGTDGIGELKVALDTLAGHPNVGPFVGRQLIQRLVTSHPTPAYVGRVAAVFADNGQGVRGDLKAVVRAILTDSEALTPTTAPGGGKLREPVVRLVQWARTFAATSPTGRWNVGDTSSPSTRLGQSPLRAPSVFNFFRPGYIPPGTAMGQAGQSAPEFQITNESTVVGYVNWMQSVVPNGVGEVKSTYADWLPLATDAAALVDALNTVLAAGQLGTASRNTVVAAVAAMPQSTDALRLRRVHAAVWLVLSAPEYLVLK